MAASFPIIRQMLQPLKHRINQWLGRDLNFGSEVRCKTLRLGSYYGGWVVQPEALSHHSIVYTFGAGEDITFDLAMIERFGVTVHAFDPTPKSMNWIKSQLLPEHFVFHPIGLADYDGTARFVLPRLDKASYHIGVTDGVDVADCRVQRLASIMHDLEHDHIDLLKMDIEGAEYAVLPDLVKSQIPIRQLLVEFHHKPGDQPSLNRTREAVHMLHAAGYRIFDVSPTGMEYSFVK